MNHFEFRVDASMSKLIGNDLMMDFCHEFTHFVMKYLYHHKITSCNSGTVKLEFKKNETSDETT